MLRSTSDLMNGLWPEQSFEACGEIGGLAIVIRPQK